ncbi:hypothetical protein MUP32_01020 [Candidatus Microgenomates bacterium]|nr:hypothetical protein [Candidatus Microgenomates bacterium]
MKLHISRKQGDVKGTKFLGIKMGEDHVGFYMTAKAELTDQERGLIDKYGVRNYVLYQKLADVSGKTQVLRKVTISSLMDGENFSGGALDLLSNENEIKEACQSFKIYIEFLKKFGGDEIIEY